MDEGKIRESFEEWCKVPDIYSTYEVFAAGYSFAHAEIERLKEENRQHKEAILNFMNQRNRVQEQLDKTTKLLKMWLDPQNIGNFGFIEAETRDLIDNWEAKHE